MSENLDKVGGSGAGVSLIEEIGGYSILNRRVPLRFLWLALFNTKTAKAGTVFIAYGFWYPGPGF